MGIPSFLIPLLARHSKELEASRAAELTSTALGPFEIGEEPLMPILFQAGFLAIHDYQRAKGQTMGFSALRPPNREVTETFEVYVQRVKRAIVKQEARKPGLLVCEGTRFVL